MELTLPAPKIYVTFSVKQHRKALKRAGINYNPVDFGSALAVTTTYESDHPGDRTVVMVCFPKVYEPSEQLPASEIYALFAHEAVHVAQSWCRSLGEHTPASEEMAYMTQTAMYAIMHEYEKQLSKTKGE